MFRKKDDKLRDARSFKKTHELHECEDVPEDSEGEDGDDERNEVYLEDQRQSDEPEELEEDEQEEEEPDEKILEAFMAAWSAKKKMTQQKVVPRFWHPRHPKGQGQQSSGWTSVDPRREASRHADCKQLGHWK